mmetsp:Transcript_2572/g.7120  ORF Transcript_2572/g.7120 Transcript_2572/m.7120 type:complete len:99 (+) Transcript_2572:128-424(+)
MHPRMITQEDTAQLIAWPHTECAVPRQAGSTFGSGETGNFFFMDDGQIHEQMASESGSSASVLPTAKPRPTPPSSMPSAGSSSDGSKVNTTGVRCPPW